ncbi:metallophosphoesterase family protein [Deinococcus kurensis]|uniref:metallophosphoesterase family protein n=1 Tax=Deinococcus kurensis TaxID=2662757 RepID=UPI0012D2CFCE|nr:metallophosphoesterase family protein [Deinococcus kurensis]
MNPRTAAKAERYDALAREHGVAILTGMLGWKKICKLTGLPQRSARTLLSWILDRGLPELNVTPDTAQAAHRGDGIARESVRLAAQGARHAARDLNASAEPDASAPADASAPDADTDAAPREWIYAKEYVYNATDDKYVTFLKVAGGQVVVSGDEHRAMKRAYSNWDGRPASINEICRDFGMPRAYLMEYKQRHGWTHDSEPFTDEELLTRGPDELVEEALQMRRRALFHDYEKAKWAETQSKAERYDRLEQTLMLPIVRHLEALTPTYAVPRVALRAPERPFAVVVTPTDLHYGKYGWADEVGRRYDRQTARDYLISTAQALLAEVALRGAPDRFILCMGSDWFHIDAYRAQTTSGTPQDVDGTAAQILWEGCELAATYVDLLRQVAPVELRVVPGNHDKVFSVSVLLYLRAWFREAQDVTVHLGNRQRQHVVYGRSLLSFTHGQGQQEKPRELGKVIAHEAAREWGSTDFRYVFTGHLHHVFISEEGGLTYLRSPALSGNDRYHEEHGYTTSRAQQAAYVIDAERGLVSVLMAAPD